jgi:NADH:ubiquinone oxidoreductase subunit C
MEKLINVILNILPMLKDVEETDLFLFRTEEQISLSMKQFSFIILYYLLNIYWPQISELTTSRRFKAFYHLMKLLIENNVMLKLTQVVDSSKLQDESIISIYFSTRQLRSIIQKHKDFQCLHQYFALSN